MSKIIKLAIGLLAAISTVPVSQSMATTNNIPDIHQTSGAIHAQVILNVRPQIQRGPQYNRRGAAERRRQMELAREREAEARREAERRRREYRRRH